MKVLHCPLDVGGQAWGLAQAEKSLGIESTVLVRQTLWHGYPNDIDLHFEQAGAVGKIMRLLPQVVEAVRSCDVLHFNWGTSLVDYWPWGANLLDLPLFWAMGKRIVVTFQGCDARQKGPTSARGPIAPCHECDMKHCNPAFDRLRRRRIDRIVRYAHQTFVLNPDLCRFVPGSEFLPYASVDPRDWTFEEPSATPVPPFKILHMPTRRSIKGTRHVVAACDALRAKGLPIELRLVEGVPHRDVRRLIAEADIVIDQLLVGWYGAFAVEAMATGRPVVCYLRQEDLDEFVPFGEEIPIVRAEPTNLASVLEKLIREPESWKDLGARGRQLVEQRHDPLRVAQRVIAAYRGVAA